eukprot:TRINITY_DN11297_c0_g1_i1.p2 TRINITY_DN11297_c0_g1~~TRINITY_DN11297_c0_g1_i1.p2  ORF type:complete len:123 (+),score=53.03 TRINITY_DN11297_c0_g1_i1:51-419(+)
MAAPAVPREVAARLEAELKEYRSLQKEIQKIMQSRQQYTTQLNENEMVKKEFELVGADAEVFKLVGPALLKQDLEEAKANVTKRLDFIKKELERLESVALDLGKKQEEKKQKIMELQQGRGA